MHRLLTTAGILLVLVGIVSFLLPAVTNLVTFLLLVAGAAAVVSGAWILK